MTAHDETIIIEEEDIDRMRELKSITNGVPPLCDGSSYRWFDSIGATQGDPWVDWLQHLFPPGELLGRSPLGYWIEDDIEDAIRATDQLRLTVVPTTKHFTEMWATFRSHHVALDDGYKYRRKRYLVWRAAALKEMCDRDSFQDESDQRQARNKLVATLREFGFQATGTPSADYHRASNCNFWHPGRVTFSDGREGLDPLAEYVSMVLLLMQRSMRERILAFRGNLKCLKKRLRA
jgi:hypothetical protein